MTLTRSNREDLLCKITDLVDSKFYDPTFGGKNWKAIVEQHRASVVDAVSDEVFESAVGGMCQRMDGGTLGLLGPKTKITPRNSINASFTMVTTPDEGTRWVFQDVLPGGVADRAAIKPGDALLLIRNTPAIPPTKPAFPMDEKISITISRNGERKETQLELTTPRPKYKECPYAEPASLTGSLQQGLLGQIKVSLFPGIIGIDFARAVDALFSGVLSSAERLVIDLRGNPGGGIGGLALMSYLTPARVPIGYSVDRPTAERGYDREKLPRFGRIPRSKLEIPLLAIKFGTKKSVALETEGLGKKKFHGRIVLLVNEHSTGAAEMFIQFAKENHLATVVGKRTPGRLLSRSAYKIGHGYRVVIPVAAYLSWKGNRIEGNGIQPDIPADWSFEDALNGVDTQLRRAVEVATSI